MTINKIRSFSTLRFLLLTGVFALGFMLKGAAQGSPIQLSLSFTAPTCAGYADGSATAAASGGVAPYSFLWNNGLTTATILNLQAGTYSVTVSDVAGATAVGSIQVVAPAPLHFQVTVTLPSCNGGAGAMTLFPVGGTSPYDVVWSNGVVGVTANNLQPGVPYTVQATDVKGCQLDTTVLLPVIDSLSVSLLIKKAECAGVEDGTATALVNPPGGSYQYHWNVSPNNTQQITNLAPGTVVAVTVTDVNTGCVGTATGVIGTHTQVTLQVTGSGNVMCAGDTTGVATAIAGHGTSPYTYVWNGPGINNVPGPTITGLGPGAYSVTATDAHGCTAAGGVNIGVVSGLHADFNLSKDCIANQFRVTFTDHSTDPGSSIVAWDWHITWSGGSFNTTQQNPPTLLLPNQSNGIAQLIVTSASGCQDTLMRAFKVDSLLDYTVINPGYSCEGAAINITVLGDSTFTYKWTPTDNLTFTPGPQHVVADPPQTTTYLLTVSNGLCFDVDSITVIRQPLLTLDAPDVSTCDTSAILSAATSVPATLIWTNVSGDTINPASVLGGTYYVTATDSFKCVRKDSAVVSVLAVAVLANVPPNACPNTPFDLTAENLHAADTVTYLWTAMPSGLVIDNPAAAATTASGTAGTYTVTLVATNQAGCTQTLTYPVNIQDSLNLTGQITISQLCNRTAVTFVNHSGIAGQWNFGDNVGMSTQDSVTYPYAGPGLYPVTFTSAAACVLPFAQQVNVTPDVFTVTAQDVTGCGATAALTATVSAGGTVSWTDLNNLPVDPAGVGAGIYIAIGTDSTNQCQDRDTVTVTLSPASVNATVPASACVNTAIDLTAENLNGGDVVTYVWTSSPAGLVIDNPAAAATTASGTAGTYTVTLVATNQAGCTLTLTYPVNIQDSLNLTGQISVDYQCQGVSVTFVNTSGYAGTWDFGDGNGSLLDSIVHIYATGGPYDVTFISNAACANQFAQTIQVQNMPAVMVALPIDTVLCGDNSLSLSVDSVTAGTTLKWSASPNFNPVISTDPVVVIQPANSGLYYVQATDATGCSAIDSIQVINAPAAIEADPALLKLCQGNEQELTVNNLHPNDMLTYSWSGGLPPIPNPVIGPSADASYTVTVTNQYGCTDEGNFDVHVITVGVTAEVTGSDTVCTNQSTTLLATPSGNANTYLYAWEPASSLSGANTPDPVATPNGQVTYTVTVWADSICPATASVTVYFRETECREPYIFVPKAFTPNGDGHNDRFRVRGADIRLLYFVVYDRWGEEVYKTEDPNDLGWDGTFRGEPSTPDSYGWYLRVTCGNGAIFEDKGDVTLLK